MACPHVAGTVALIISRAKAMKMTLNTTQILAILQDTATPLDCPAVEPYIPFVRSPLNESTISDSRLCRLWIAVQSIGNTLQYCPCLVLNWFRLLQ